MTFRKRPLGVLGALGGWFLVIDPPRRQGRQAIGETNRPNRDSACHPIRRSSNLINFPSFPSFPWTKNGLWATAHPMTFRAFSLLRTDEIELPKRKSKMLPPLL